MHEKLRRLVSDACGLIYRRGLCDRRRGIVSCYDRKCGVILIRPDSPGCDAVTPIDILAATPDGTVIDGEGNLPGEFASHLAIYEAFAQVNSIVCANPTFATVFAQAGKPIKPYGTTHAEYFGDMIPCTRKLTPSEIETDYPSNVGRLIAETMLGESNLLTEVGAALVCSDEVYCFADTPQNAVDRLDAVEQVARMAFYTELLMRGGPSGGTRMQEDLLRLRYDAEHKG